MKGAHPCLKSVEALVCAAARGLGVFDCRVEFVCLREVVGLDLCEKPGDRGDKGLHAGVFLGGSRSCKPLNPVGLWVCLAGEDREIGGVAARAFCCGGVGCERCCPPPCEGGRAGSKQRRCWRPRLNHNRWPRATRHGEGVEGGLSQRLKGVGRGVEGGIFVGPRDHCAK